MTAQSHNIKREEKKIEIKPMDRKTIHSLLDFSIDSIYRGVIDLETAEDMLIKGYRRYLIDNKLAK